MEEDPPAFQQVSMFGHWLLVQRRRLASTLGAGAGGGRLATDGSLGRGVSLVWSLLGLEADWGEGPLCEIQ